MNMNLKTVVSLAVVVVLSAGLAMAGRGGGGGGHSGGGGGAGRGGGGGGGGYRGGGGGRIPRRRRQRRSQPARSSSHAFFQHPASEFQHASPAAGVFAECRGQPPGQRPRGQAASGQRAGTAGTPTWDNRLNTANRTGIDNRANPGSRTYVANRPISGNNVNINRRTTSCGRRTEIGTAATGTTAIGTATGTTPGIIGRWAGGRRRLGRRRPFRDSLVLGVLAVLQPVLRRIRSSTAVQPSITRSRSWWPSRPPRRPAPRPV